MTRKNSAPSFTSPCKGEVGREAAGRGSLSDSRFSRTRGMTSKARGQRKEMTKAERKLWNVLRRDQLETLHFRRQHPIGPYVLDFYCPAIQMALELDGGQHGFDHTRARDRRRTKWLASKGITVLRFWNDDVIDNLDGVWSEIVRVAETLRLRNATPSRLATRADLPLLGGGKEYASRQKPDS